MVAWNEFAASAPMLAEQVRARLEQRKHHTMATLRADGSPRVSGTEVRIVGGALTFGVMRGAVRAADLRRDPRVAIHSQNVDPPDDAPEAWAGEAKVSGRAVAVPSPPVAAEAEQPAGDHFAVDLDEVVLTTIGPGGDHLVVEWWTPSGGVRRVERR